MCAASWLGGQKELGLTLVSESPTRAPAAIDPKHGLNAMDRNVLAEHNGRRRRGGERRGVDPDTLDDEIARLRDLDLPTHRKSLPRVNERRPPDPDWASRLVQGLLVPPLPQNYRKACGPDDLTAPQLRAEWRRLYRGQPPRLSRDLLVRSIAYRLQELAHGGLSKATRRKLLALTKVLQSNEEYRAR